MIVRKMPPGRRSISHNGVVHGRGVEIDHGEYPDPLAAVQVKTLFTALCYLSAGSPAMPRDALDSLATEATSVAAAHINRIVPE